MRRLAPLGLAALLAACQAATERPPAPTGPAAPAEVRGPGPELDLSQVMATVRRAVRRDGDRLLARGDHHQLTVNAAGLARIAPLGQPKGIAPVELRLETSAVTRGGGSLLGHATARAEGPAVVVTRGQVEERLVNGDGGVEQRWQLAARPSGSGDLVVSVGVAGLPFAGATASGLHFGDPLRGAMVRYGLATWVDAGGTRLPLATRFAAGSIQITVPAAALDAARYPAVIDPIISAERYVDQPPGGVAATGMQLKPAVACLATGTCLVAWQDQALQFNGVNTQLRAARVGGSPLAILDPNGLDVDDSSDGGDCGAPVVVAAGDEFAVVYTSTLGVSQRLMMRRVPAAGSLAVPRQQVAPFAYAFSAAAGKPEAGGTPVAISWEVNQIWFASYLKGATVVAPRIPIDRSSVPADESARWDRPAITWTGTRWFMAWRGGIGTAFPSQVIRVAFLDAAGTFQSLETNGFYIMGTNASGTQEFFSQPRVAADGSDNVLVLTTSAMGNEPTSGVVRAMRFGKHGSDSVNWGIGKIPDVNTSDRVTGLSTWWDGSSFQVLLVYQQASFWETAEVRSVPNLPFTVLPADPPPAGTQVPTTQLFPANSKVEKIRAAPDGLGGTLLTWEDAVNGDRDVRTNRPATGGGDPRVGSLLLTTGTADEGQPAVAFDGGTWLVAWEDQRTVVTGGGGDVFALRLARTTGAPLDSQVLQVTTATGGQGSVVAAGGGGGFLVAWEDFSGTTSDIRATRITTAGALQSAPGVSVANSATRHESPLAAAFDGANYHLLYSERDATSPPNMLLKELRIQPADLLRLAPVTVAPTPADPYQPLDGGLACRSDGCLVAWAEGGGSSVMARTVIGGVAGTPSPLVSGVLANAQPRVGAAATGSPGFLVAWTELDPAASAQNIRAQLALADGTASGSPFSLAAGISNPGEPPALSFNGFDHVVAWSPMSGGLSVGWIKADGTVRAAPSELVPAAVDGPRMRVATAGDGEGRTLMAWSAFDTTPGIRARRVKVLITSWSKLLGDTCTQATECGSGLCVEGVCCDSACGGGLGCQTCAARNGHGTAGHCTATTGDSCSDGNLCTRTDLCTATATCAGTAYTCPAPTQCQESVACNGESGCLTTNRADGTACDGGGSCKQGACVAPPGIGAVLGLSCGSGPAGPEALLLALLLLAFAGRRAGSRS